MTLRRRPPKTEGPKTEGPNSARRNKAGLPRGPRLSPLRAALIIIAMGLVGVVIGFAIVWLRDRPAPVMAAPLDTAAAEVFATTRPEPLAIQDASALRIWLCPEPSGCAIVLAGGKALLFGAPEGAGAALVAAGVRLDAFDAVLLPSLSVEAISGLMDVRQRTWLAGRRTPLVVVGPRGTTRTTAAINRAAETADAAAVAEGQMAGRFDAAELDGRNLTSDLSLVLDTGDLQVYARLGRLAGPYESVSYRIDYGGRSAVLGDCLVSDIDLREGGPVDLVVLPAQDRVQLEALARLKREAGNRQDGDAVMRQIGTCADPAGAERAARAANPALVVLYPVWPVPAGPAGEAFWQGRLGEGVRLGRGQDLIEVPVGRGAIVAGSRKDRIQK